MCGRAREPGHTVHHRHGRVGAYRRPVDVQAGRCRTIDQVDEVVGGRGDAARCWCQWDRLVGGGFQRTAPEEMRARLADQIAADGAGVVASIEGVTVGWCSVGPRVAFPRIARSPVMRTTDLRPDAPDVWSVTCFVVSPSARRRGVVGVLLDAAVERAAEGNASWVEGYPIDTVVRRGVSSSALYRGPLSVFLAAGFEEVARPRPDRVVVRRKV